MSTPLTPRLAAAAALLALLTGCGDDPGPVASEPTGGETSMTPGDDRVGPVDDAVADLADRLDMSAAEIEVLEAKAVTWKDGSLGCPEPGKFYTQSLVDGYKIVLRAGQRTYPYHSGGGRGPFLCENLQPETPPGPAGSD